MAVTPEEAIACLDLLRDLPDPWADEWSWLLGLAEDAGLEMEDLSGLSFMEAVEAVKEAEDLWNFGGSVLRDDWSLRLTSRHEGDIRVALIQGMGLPLIAQRLSVQDLVDVAKGCYRVCPRTFRLEQIRAVHIHVHIPYIPGDGIDINKEVIDD